MKRAVLALVLVAAVATPLDAQNYRADAFTWKAGPCTKTAGAAAPQSAGVPWHTKSLRLHFS